MNKRELSKNMITWQFQMSCNFKTYHHTVERDNVFGLQKETITKKTKSGYGLGKTKVFYFIDGIAKKFTDIDELIIVYNKESEK